MTYYIPKTIKSEIKIAKFIYAKDLLIAIIFMAIVFTFESMVYEKIRLQYYIFYILLLFFLLFPSSYNAGKKNLYSLQRALLSDKSVYMSISNNEGELNDKQRI